MITVKMKDENCSVTVEGSATEALEELSEITKIMLQKTLTELNIRPQYYAGCVRYFIDMLEREFL